MEIKLLEPLIIQAVEEKTYSEGWVSFFCVSAPTVKSGTVRLELSAYNPETGEIAPGGAVEILTADSMMEAVLDPSFPEAKALYEAVTAVVGPFRVWVRKRKVSLTSAELLTENQEPANSRPLNLNF